MPRDAPPVIRRREARIAAMHIVFSAISNDCFAADSSAGVESLQESARSRQAIGDALTATIVRVFDQRRADIEAWMAASYDRPLANMTMLERALISTAAAEMLGCPGTSHRVIINEAVEIAKTFGADGGSALVNGVLNDIATRQRQ